jgi:hypothetical protein
MKRTRVAGLALCLLLAGCFSALPDDATDEQPTHPAEPGGTTIAPNGGPLVLVHYMPWYKGPADKSRENTRSEYGGHWTGWGKIDPTQVTADGRAYIYAHQYPLTGPYHGGSEALLEYQAALMKLAGIDGVIFDWYGSYEANDFGEIHSYTKAMVAVLKRAGLRFLVCYEDNTLNMMGKTGDAALAIGGGVFDWAQRNWFADSTYIHYEGRPVVLCFGPQHFRTREQWDTVFSAVNPKPWFADLDNRYSWADGSYNWPPMGRSDSDGILQRPALENYLNGFYNGKQRNNAYRIATVFSAFDDCYEDVGNTSYGTLEYADGAVFDVTFKKAMEFRPHIIQIATWNDYGEGTIIEPTIERGYNELEYLQDREKEWNAAFPYTKEELRIPIEFYKLHYTNTATAAQKAAIAEAYQKLFAGDHAGWINAAAAAGIAYNTEIKPLLRN